MERTAVPEAPVDEYRHSGTRECDVDPTTTDDAIVDAVSGTRAGTVPFGVPPPPRCRVDAEPSCGAVCVRWTRRVAVAR